MLSIGIAPAPRKVVVDRSRRADEGQPDECGKSSPSPRQINAEVQEQHPCSRHRGVEKIPSHWATGRLTLELTYGVVWGQGGGTVDRKTPRLALLLFFRG
jgi:hypothetical protein